MSEPLDSVTPLIQSDTADRVKLLFEGLLNRPPSEAELIRWTAIHDQRKDFFLLFKAIIATREYKDKNRVKSAWLPGHFYSPIVDPEQVKEYVGARRASRTRDILGIPLDMEAMRDFWLAHQQFIASTPFQKEPFANQRYSWGQSPYPIGDATTYRAIINHTRPNRIIEVGSGYSTACALDTLDEVGLAQTRMTCIEPYPAALHRRLRSGDLDRVTIIESIVQNVPVETFRELEDGDILFIDSTHVLKTGSDVHFELFDVLPSLKPGVLVHFHDIRWPFEYPAEFIFDRNFSWNEAYALRAFLMFNNRFSVFFYNSLFATLNQNLARETFPDFMLNVGSSIWLKSCRS